jgi:hypothetical protein
MRTHSDPIPIARAVLAAVLTSALLLPPPFAFACMPAMPEPVFTDAAGPDLPNDDYARGELGLLEHTYHHQPLYIAYRNLSGKLLTEPELKALSEPSVEEALAAKNWIGAWGDARAKILDKVPDAREYGGGYGTSRHVPGTDSYLYYYNCLNSAFENAVQTLHKRVEQFGAQSAAVKDWLAAQDQVFENCGSASYPPKPTPIVIPAAARSSDPVPVRADRAYQIAAAYFYAGEYDQASSAFEAIAKDPDSPYRVLAPYLVARALIREGTLSAGAGEDSFDPRTLTEAETKLRAILADKDLTEIHDRAQRLLAFVLIRLHRQQRFRELETSLSTPGEPKTFQQNLIDYLWLLDRPVLSKGVELPPAAPGQPASRRIAADEESRLKPGDLTDWIFTFQRVDADAYQHSVQLWRQTKSLPWLVAALAKADTNDKDAADLSAAAAKVAPDSPAYVTLTFHRLRLLEQSGDSASVRNQIDRLLSQPNLIASRSAINQFIALRMKVATGLPDFLHFAARVPSDLSDNPNPNAPIQDIRYFDTDAAITLTERLPLRLLAEAAKSAPLRAELRRQIAIAAWTRAILLNDEAIARDLVPTTQDLVPEIKEALADYANAPDGASRQFAAVFTILRNPALRPFVAPGFPRENPYRFEELHFDKIDSLRDNWWCSWTPGSGGVYFGQDYYHMLLRPSSPLQEIYPDGKIGDPAFLTGDERAIAARERAELEVQPAAPNWLGKQALDWAKSHPDDPRVPEALYLVVRARRYGCSDPSPENYSKAAFTLLHSRYPESDWTKKTPYWFQ